MGSEMNLLASAGNSDVDLALRRVEMSCVQKIILTKVDAGQVGRKASNYKFAFMQSERTRQRLTFAKIFVK